MFRRLTLLSFLAVAGCQPLTPAPGPANPTPAPPAEPTPTPAPAQAPAGQRPPAVRRGPLLAEVKAEPTLHVRVAAAQARLDVGRPGETVQVSAPGTAAQAFACPLTLTREGDAFRLTTRAGQWLWTSPRLDLRPAAGQTTMQVGRSAYPGHLWVQGNGAGLDAINEVALEDYLPGVLSKELYDGWEPETFKAQAVAARSYAVWEMTLRRSEGRPFDLEANEASQAYIGTGHPKAQAAVAATRGIVLSYDGRILPAFYSASAGGTTQDAAAAFPDRVDDLPPLRGRAVGDESAACPRYRWGPLTRTAEDSARRIQGWAAAKGRPEAALRGLAAVETTRAATGRPTRVTLTGTDGRSFTMAAEDFRLAINSGEPALTLDQKLLSSHCDLRLENGVLRIENGRGFGHGVGLDQWGAQGLAKQGRNAAWILGWYYPGANPVRAW